MLSSKKKGQMMCFNENIVNLYNRTIVYLN